MKRLFWGTTVACLAATTAIANVTIQDIDVTGDNFATFEEVKNAMPRMDMTAFKDIDTNSDMRLSAEEINAPEAQAEFATHQVLGAKERPLVLLDADGDGFISYDDFQRVYPKMSEATFKKIDTNSDNRLSYVEYYTPETQTALAQCTETHFLDLASMDTDGDNFLSMDELKVGYPKVTNADFRTIDLNSDNRVSSVELLAPTAQCLEGKN